MNNRELFYFVGKCLALDANPGFRAEFVAKSSSDQMDWLRFVKLCSNHLVLPAVYIKLKSHDLLGCIPEELAAHLQEVYELNVSRNEQILRQLEVITNTLNKENIQPIFLKGAAYLLDGLYADIGERILGDIDFLVPESDYLIAANAFEGEGYSKFQETPDYADIKSAKHYPRLFHPGFIASIEVHRIPVNEKYAKWFDYKTIGINKKTVEQLPGCFVPSDHHKIIHNFVHSQLSNEGYLFGVVSLREIYDLLMLSKRFSLEKTLPEIKTKKKAIAYFALARVILGLDDKFFSKRNHFYKILFWKHSLNQNSVFFYHFNRSIIFIGQRILKGYIGQLFMAVYSKEKRQYLSRRIKDPKWYGDHLKLYTRFFKNR